MKQRIITGIVMLAVFLPLLIIKELFPAFQILMLLLCLVASWEMIKLFSKEKDFSITIKIIIMVSSALIYMSMLTEWDNSVAKDSFAGDILVMLNLSIGFLPMLLLVLLTFFLCMIFAKDFNGSDIGKALTTTLYTGVCFGALSVLRFIGLRFMIYLFMITVLTDVFAYFGGVTLGKHKMCPNISPKKSWEGAIIGTAVAVVVATCFAYFYSDIHNGLLSTDYKGQTLFEEAHVFWKGNFAHLSKPLKFLCILITSTFVSISGQLGDLVASKLKRTYEIKDFGNIFPGHGGVLDRFDSAIFAALALLLIFVLF